MASQKKKNKQVNSYQVKGSLKTKGAGIKRLTFYTSSERKRLNSQVDKIALSDGG